MNIIDRLMLRLLAKRLARCRRKGDDWDYLSDQVIEMLRAELERRDVVLQEKLTRQARESRLHVIAKQKVSG